MAAGDTIVGSYYDEVSAGFIPLIFTSSDESHIPVTDTVYGDLEMKVDGLRPLFQTASSPKLVIST
jgi:hypothetical protein